MRPIDADALVVKLDDWRGDIEDVDKNDAHDVAYYSAMSRAIRFAKDAPTLDLAPVVHGAIIESNENGKCKRVFSCCGTDFTQLTMWMIPNYCHNCGAKMDGGKKDD